MPYIKKEDRAKLDYNIDRLLHNVMVDFNENTEDGAMNYIISKMLGKIYSKRYFNLNRAIGMLECVKQEFYRKVVGPYEETKIIENGDI